MTADSVLSPDQLIQIVIDEISYRKGKITLGELWEIASDYIDLSDDYMKSFTLNNILAHPDTVVLVSGKPVDSKSLTYEQMISNATNVQIGITDDKLWLTLTGHSKKEASVVGFAFDLLLEVAAAKEKGINTMELARNTGQDPRSVTGRIKKFSHLVTMTQLVYKGHLVKSLTLNRFVREKPKKPYINIKQHLPDIVQIVKDSKNGVRQVIDLKREMGFDKEKRLSKAFTSAISWLDQQGYLRKVIVVSPANPSVKIRCVQFVKSYVVKDISSNNVFEDESADEDDEDGLNGEEQDMAADDTERATIDDEDLIEGFDKVNATNILQDSNLVIQDSSAEKKEFTINRFYPLQTQIYSMADKAGLSGISTLELISNFVGPGYKRCFSKNTEYFIEGTSQKSSKFSSDDGIGLVKIYDFEGKKKFHRIFTKKNFAKLTDQESEYNEGDLPEIEEQPYTLEELSKMNFVPLNASLRYMNDGEKDIFFWHGELDIPASSKTSVRGRKRVTLPDTEEKPKRIKVPELTSQMKEEHIEVPALKNAPASITVNGFTGSSLKSIQRQKALLTVLRESGGVRYIGDQLYDSISKHMGTDMILDKKTLKKESEVLVESGKLKIIEDPNTKRRLLCLPDTSDEKINDYLVHSKDTRGRFNAEVVCKEDIYFFDQTEKDRFHRSAKAAKRIKEFERKSRKSQPDSTTPDVISDAPTATKKLRKKAKPKNTTKATVKKEKEKVESPSSIRSNFHSGTKEGMKALIYAVVITKSIKGQILWDEITKIFPHNALESLKKQWRIRRVRMGESGWRALMEKWRKIMVDAVKDERATIADAEQLNLIKLINLWLNTKETSTHFIKLYKDYSINRSKYTFVPISGRAGTDVKGRGVAMSSMIQRENFLLNKKYSITIDASRKEKTTEDEIRTIVRSMLFEKTSAEPIDVNVLQGFNHEQVDKVILDMAKDRLVTFMDSSKLQLTERGYDLLKYQGDTSFLQEASACRTKAIEIFNNKNALIISEEPLRHVPCVLLDLIENYGIKSEVVPLEVQHKKMYYTTRQYEVRALTPPLAFYSPGQIKDKKIKKANVPVGKAFSRLWIDGSSQIREHVWKSVVSLILKEILFHPGVTADCLADKLSILLSPREVTEVLQWLTDTRLVSSIKFNGYMVCDGWYFAVG